MNEKINDMFWKNSTKFTSMTASGQVRIPDSIRKALGIEPEAPLMITQDEIGIHIVPLPCPSLEEFKETMAASAAWARDIGLTEQDIADVIREVRQEKRALA